MSATIGCLLNLPCVHPRPAAPHQCLLHTPIFYYFLNTAWIVKFIWPSGYTNQHQADGCSILSTTSPKKKKTLLASCNLHLPLSCCHFV
jgi:hypothetical protein